MGGLHSFSTGAGARKRKSHRPPISGPKLQVQGASTPLPNYPFQPLPPPNGPAPYCFDLSQLLTTADVQSITQAGEMVFHTVGDTGDYRGQQQNFVAAMMTADANGLPANRKPAFYYHLGDVIYFAGDIIRYPDNFYATYKNYPGFIVAIPGNHDCQPDDPADGAGDPNKYPLDGFVQNFMAKNPTQQGAMKISSGRTEMDLPNVYWTFTTPFATIIGLFSNVGEDEAEIHQDQIDWFQGELKAADKNKALIVTIHHPPFSGDDEHTGSTVADTVLSQAFQATGRYPDMVLSGHVHNYQRFTSLVQAPDGKRQIPYIVAGAGGYINLGKMQKINGAYPDASKPLKISNTLKLETYDQNNFGFLRLAVSKTQIVGTYQSAPYSAGATPNASVIDRFTVNLVNHTVATGSGSGANKAEGSRKTSKSHPKKKTGKKRR